MQGWADSPLTKNGAEHVKNSIENLLKEDISAIYSSDMIRTQETSQIIVGKYKTTQGTSLEVKLDSNLREICFGVFEGELSSVAWGKISKELGYDNMIQMFENETIGKVYDTIAKIDESNDAETSSEFSSRINYSLNSIAKKHTGKTVVIVTHGNVIRTLLSEISKSNKMLKDIANAQSFVLQYHDGTFKLEDR